MLVIPTTRKRRKRRKRWQRSPKKEVFLLKKTPRRRTKTQPPRMRRHRPKSRSNSLMMRPANRLMRMGITCLMRRATRSQLKRTVTWRGRKMMRKELVVMSNFGFWFTWEAAGFHQKDGGIV